MGQGYSFFENLADRFDIPAQAMPGLPRISIAGRRRVFIENHGGIIKYSEDEIELGGKYKVIIRGSGLRLLAMNKDDLVIGGNILSAGYQLPIT